MNTRGGKVTYCQLMQTQYRDGTSRQRLVKSLGRADRLDLDALREMAAAVSRGRTDVLTPWLLTVLPGGREYGPVSLLLRAMEGLGMDRSFSRAAREAGEKDQAADALTALTAYYLLSYQRGTPFFQWLDQCYVPGRAGVDEASLDAAARLLLAPEKLYPGLASRAQGAMGREGDWGFCYAVPCQYDFLPEDRPTDALFLLSGEDVPLDSCLWEGEAEKAAELAARSVILARDPALLSRHGLGPENSWFICATPPGTLPPFVEEEGELTAFLREEGEFLAFREYGYREKRFGQVRAVILRSSSGQAAALTQWHKEPRELILTNTALPVEKVLEKFLILDKVLDITHPVYLTEDLQFLRLGRSRGEVLALLEKMQFLQLFLCLYLGRRLARCRTTLDDALAALGGVPCVPLRWEGGELLLTAPLDPRQGEILGSVG